MVVGVELLDSCDAPFVTGTAEGMMAGGEGVCKQKLSKACQLRSSDKSPGGRKRLSWVDVALPHALNGRSKLTIGLRLRFDGLSTYITARYGTQLKCREKMEVSQQL